MDIHKVIDPGWPNKLVQPVPRKQEEHGILFCSHLAVVQFDSKAIARKMETREYTLSAPDESRDPRSGGKVISRIDSGWIAKLCRKRKFLRFELRVGTHFQQRSVCGNKGTDWQAFVSGRGFGIGASA
jgi:hypothetical protein